MQSGITVGKAQKVRQIVIAPPKKVYHQDIMQRLRKLDAVHARGSPSSTSASIAMPRI
jgi:hypothetical protein